MRLLIISPSLLETYLQQVVINLQSYFDELQDAPVSTANFSFYTSVASVFSSKIEGEPVELDSYIKHKRDGIQFQPDYTKKVDDLYSAYLYAQSNVLNEDNLKTAHSLLSKNLLTTTWQGTYRRNNMFVTNEQGSIDYVAAAPGEVQTEINKLLTDIETLLKAALTIEECFYYASMIHLVFVKIHAWNDGNGRCARLLEKWFLAEKLGAKAWFIQSEKLYYNFHQQYYQNLRRLGLEYELLDYNQSMPFLLMLPGALMKQNGR